VEDLKELKGGLEGAFISVILPTWETEILRIMVPGSSGKKNFERHHLNKWLGQCCLSSQVLREAK
jgi:hypothetical protein